MVPAKGEAAKQTSKKVKRSKANMKAREGIGEESRGSERGQDTCSLVVVKGFRDPYRERPEPDRSKPQPVDIGQDEDSPAQWMFV